MVSLFAAAPGDAWVFVAHDVLAFALAGLLVVKLRRVWSRLVRPSEWDRQVKAGVLATLFVAAALVSGWVWSGGGRVSLAGYTLISWHLVLGWVLVAAVARSEERRVGKGGRTRGAPDHLKKRWMVWG